METALLKVCSKCEISKPVNDFAKRGRSFRSYCNDCKSNVPGICADCKGPTAYSHSTRCRACYRKHNRGANSPRFKSGRATDKNGYVLLTGYYEHPNSHTHFGKIAEHVLVMSEHLGRPLIKGENVHHINGVRDDNRIENLELWSTSQPPGQRVVDKVAWAKELLRLYEPGALNG